MCAAAARTLLRQCLVKDAASGSATSPSALRTRSSGRRARLPAPSSGELPRGTRRRRVAARTIGAVALAAVAATLTWFVTRPAAPRVVRTDDRLRFGGVRVVEHRSRHRDHTDGSRIVYHGGDNQLLVRPLSQLEPQCGQWWRAPGAFISPDGQGSGF